MGRSVRLKATTLTVTSRLSARFHKSILGFFLSKTTSGKAGIFSPFFSSALVEREPPPTIFGSSHSSHCPN